MSMSIKQIAEEALEMLEGQRSQLYKKGLELNIERETITEDYAAFIVEPMDMRMQSMYEGSFYGNDIAADFREVFYDRLRETLLESGLNAELKYHRGCNEYEIYLKDKNSVAGQGSANI